MDYKDVYAKLSNALDNVDKGVANLIRARMFLVYSGDPSAEFARACLDAEDLLNQTQGILRKAVNQASEAAKRDGVSLYELCAARRTEKE